MAHSLADAGEAVAAAVAEVIPSISRAVKIAVEAVTVATASRVLDIEQHLGRQIADVAAPARAYNEKRLDALMEVVAPMAAGLRELRREVLALRQGVAAWYPEHESGLALVAPAGSPFSVSSPAILAPQAPVSLTDARARGFSAAPGAFGILPLPEKRSLRYGDASTLSSGVIRGRDLVCQLLDKLNGVDIYEDVNQCVPMLTMVVGLGWEAALDEYALGGANKVSMRELEATFGDRWRKV